MMALRRSLDKLGMTMAFAFAILVGSVTDRTTGQTLPGVTITVGAAHTVSRSDGSYKLAGVKPGHATISVMSDDVPPQRFPVTVGKTATRADLTVCSTTLDYNCGAPQ